MNTFIERLLSLFPTNARPANIAISIGMTQPGFNRVYKEGAIPKAETLIKIQEVTGCDLNWLLTGKGEPFADVGNMQLRNSSNINHLTDTRGHPISVEDFALIPLYDVQASAGAGVYVDNEMPINTLAFRRDWIRNNIHVAPENLSVITVRGDSMSGVLEDKDIILINHQDTNPRDGIYVLNISGDLFVKRVQRLPENIIRVKSANPEYENFDVKLNENNEIKIIGRVLWFGRTL